MEDQHGRKVQKGNQLSEDFKGGCGKVKGRKNRTRWGLWAGGRERGTTGCSKRKFGSKNRRRSVKRDRRAGLRKGISADPFTKKRSVWGNFHALYPPESRDLKKEKVFPGQLGETRSDVMPLKEGEGGKRGKRKITVILEKKKKKNGHQHAEPAEFTVGNWKKTTTETIMRT